MTNPTNKQIHKRLAELGMSPSERKAVIDAAKDCHLSVRDYCRVMLLCAAGMGGISEHMERVFGASADAEVIAQGKKPAKRRDNRGAF